MLKKAGKTKIFPAWFFITDKAGLDLKLYEIRREHYIQQLIDKAEIGRMRLKAKDDEIIAAEEELRVNQILLESGRIKEVDLMHTETELSKLKAERKSEEANMNKIYFYLENGLYLVNNYWWPDYPLNVIKSK